jgi:hypothetical protein
LEYVFRRSFSKWNKSSKVPIHLLNFRTRLMCTFFS